MFVMPFNVSAYNNILAEFSLHNLPDLPELNINACYSKETLEHVRKTDYSNQSYYLNGKPPVSSKNVYEIMIKLSLCLVSIMASLIGNLLVLYSIFILPKLQKKYTTSTAAAAVNAAALAVNGELTPINQTQQYATHNVTSIALQKKLSCTGQMNVAGGYALVAPSPISNYKLSSQRKILLKIEKSSNPPNALGTTMPRKATYSFIKPHNNAPKSPYYRKTVNLFILNLSVCDLMIVCWCSWVHMVNSITDRWLLGAFFCRFNTFVQILSLVAAISTLSVISFERFTGIVCSMNNKLNRKKTIIIILCIWIFSIVAAIPALLYRKEFKRVWKDHVESWCGDEWPQSYTITKIDENDCITGYHEPLRQIYYTFISCVLFFIPIIIMSICYFMIILKLWGTKIPGEFCLEKKLLLKRRKKVAIMLVWLLLSFAICWSPAQFLILYEAHRGPYNEQMPYWFNWIYFLVYLLAYTNSGINPIMYAGLNRHYRKAFRIRC